MSSKILEALNKEKKVIADLTTVAVEVGTVISLIRKMVNRIKLRRAKRRAAKLMSQLERERIKEDVASIAASQNLLNSSDDTEQENL